MEISSDFADLLLAFNDAGAKYLVVGALAVSYHGQPRATADFAVWVESSLDNARRVYRALAAFGAPLKGIQADEFASDDLVFQIGVPPLRIDVITGIDGVEFADAWGRRVDSELGDVSIHVIGRDDLIANKLATGRDKDLLDVRRLRDAG